MSKVAADLSVVTSVGLDLAKHVFQGKRCSQATAVHGMSSPTAFAG